LNREYIVEATPVIALVEHGRRQEAIARFKATFTPLGNRLARALSEWIQYDTELGSSAARAAQAVIDETRTQILAANAAALLLTGVLGFLTVRRIVKPIQALERSVKAGGGRGLHPLRSVYRRRTRPAASLARSTCSNTAPPPSTNSGGSNRARAHLVGDLQKAGSLAEFGQRLLSGIVPLLRGGVGSFYVSKEDEAGLERTARTD
jgi:hypothetical protein